MGEAEKPTVQKARIQITFHDEMKQKQEIFLPFLFFNWKMKPELKTACSRTNKASNQESLSHGNYEVLLIKKIKFMAKENLSKHVQDLKSFYSRF